MRFCKYNDAFRNIKLPRRKVELYQQKDLLYSSSVTAEVFGNAAPCDIVKYGLNIKGTQ